jgi:transposase
VCIRDERGEIIVEQRWATRRLGELLARRPPSRGIVETCAEAFGEAMRLGHQVRVVPATLVRQLGVGERGIKTDVRDARKLSEVSCRIELPSVHIPKKESRERKTTCGMRDALVRCRTLCINTVRGWLRQSGQRPRSGGADSFVPRVRTLLTFSPMPAYVEHLTKQIRRADRDVELQAKADPICRRLMTVPGVGPVTALRFVATLDEIGRFSSVHRVESYVGLVPGEHSSSDSQRRTGITKAGSSELRYLLIQSAWAARRCRRLDPMQTWASEIERRRGKRIAAVALARKLCGILFALWRDGTTYEPSRSTAQAQAQAQ